MVVVYFNLCNYWKADILMTEEQAKELKEGDQIVLQEEIEFGGGLGDFGARLHPGIICKIDVLHPNGLVNLSFPINDKIDGVFQTDLETIAEEFNVFVPEIPHKYTKIFK